MGGPIAITIEKLETMKWLGAFMCIPPVQRSLVGAATTEDEGFALVQAHRPSLLIVSQHLEPAIKTLLVADDDNEVLVREVLAQGCDGICFLSERFMPALKVVAGGGVNYPHQVSGVMRRSDGVPVADALTGRELEVLEGLMLGLTDRQISARLIVGTETVKTRIKQIYQKLGVDNRTKAVVRGIGACVLTLESAMAGAMA